MPLRAWERRGLCGSPVLNDKDELIGSHTGSSIESPFDHNPAPSYSLVTPARYLKMLVEAYHHPEQAQMPFYIDDTHFISLHPTEYVTAYRLLDAQRNPLTGKWIKGRFSHADLSNTLAKYPQAAFLQLTTRRSAWSDGGTAWVENTAPDATLPQQTYLYDLRQHQPVR